MSDIEKLLWILVLTNIVFLGMRFYDGISWHKRRIADLEHEVLMHRAALKSYAELVDRYTESLKKKTI